MTMPQIQPSISKQELLCAETPAPPCGIVVFGGSGDLTQRKLIPSLFELYKRRLLSDHFYFAACGRKSFSDDDYRKLATEAILEKSESNEQVSSFVNKMHFLTGSYDDPAFYDLLKTRLDKLDNQYETDRCHVYYLAVPPSIYGTIVEKLGNSGLSCIGSPHCRKSAKLVIEKPFGRDLESAKTLNDHIQNHFSESQVYRIDHYLGKETVQNILMFRFANAIFEPLWNRNFIDHIQITIAESIGIEHRAGYYDKSGAVRDMFQNHMLAMLSLVAMEPPASFSADGIRDEKVKLLRSIHPLELDPYDGNVVTGQYTGGRINAQDVCGYLDEENIPADSTTETFIATRMFIDNWRWKGVPFCLRTGKRLANRLTEIAISFKTVPHSMFESIGLEDMPPNVLVLKIQPNEGIELSFQAKRPGSKACMSTLTMNFNYNDVFKTHAPEAYQRLLLDCMTGDQTLFTRQDEVQIAWKFLEPLLKMLQNGDLTPIEYTAGAQSFPRIDALIAKDGQKWRNIGKIQ